MKTGPQYKICRRVGDKIFPKCQTTKFTIAGENKKGNQNKRRRKESEYGSQLLEKQKARFTYGISEKQFSNYIKQARKNHRDTNNLIFKLLETRLDNTVFKLGLAPSRACARQMVSHGHILINGRKNNIPSYQVKTGDKISVKTQSRDKALFNNLEERLKNYNIPSWLSFNLKNKEGEVKAMPKLGESESNINFSVIVEFYSRV